MQAFQAGLNRTLVGQICRYLARFPRAAAESNATLTRFVTAQVSKAQSHGLTWQSSTTAFVVTSHLTAPNFDDHPEVCAILEDRGILPNYRLGRALQVTSDEAWTAIQADKPRSEVTNSEEIFDEGSRAQRAMPNAPLVREPCPGSSFRAVLTLVPGEDRYPYVQEPYKLFLNDAFVKEDQTGDDGVVEFDHDEIIEGVVRVETGFAVFTIELEKFALSSSRKGIAQRLSALGYSSFDNTRNSENAEVANNGEFAIRRAQADASVTITGEPSGGLSRYLQTRIR